MVFPAVMYGCQSWTIKKAKHWRIDAFELWCGEESWESFGLQGDPSSSSYRRSVLNVHWKDWCWSWNSNTLATWCKELTHWKRPWCWERLRAGEKGTTEDEMAGWHRWLYGHESEWTLVVGDREAWRAAIHGVAKSRTRLSDWSDLMECRHLTCFTEIYLTNMF